LLPVVSNMNTERVNEEDPIRHFKINEVYNYSRGWNFSIITKKKSNNYGFLSDIDYKEGGEHPLLVVIGDSYVEAMQVENNKTMHGILAKRVEDRGYIYGIGYSGAPMSQYLSYAKYARDEFQPDAVSITIVGNDFDESLMSVRPNPGFHYFVDDQDGQLTLKRLDFEDAGLRGWMKKSAVMRYLFLTAGLDWRSIVSHVMPDDVHDKRLFIGNTSADTSEKRLLESKRVVDAFLEKLPIMSGLQESNILLVVDGMRQSLYSKEAAKKASGSYFDIMRKYFMARAKARGFEVIDMHPVFNMHYRINKQKFEYPIDAHWNELGHKLVADEIEKSDLFREIMQ